MKHLKNQKGFAAFEIVLIIIAFVAVGTAGYFAYQSRQDKTDYSVHTTKNSKKVVSQSSTPANSLPAKTTTTQFVNGATFELDNSVGTLLQWNLTQENINLSSDSLLAKEKELYGEALLSCKAQDYPLGEISVRDDSTPFAGYTPIKKLDSGKHLSYSDSSRHSLCYRSRDKLQSTIDQQVQHLKKALAEAH